jgi:hypothetical protein
MRWRGSVRQMARLRTTLDAEQLTTLRYEQVMKQPAAAIAAIGQFIGAELTPLAVRGAARPAMSEPGNWRRVLTQPQVAEIEKVAGSDLRRVGYG